MKLETFHLLIKVFYSLNKNYSKEKHFFSHDAILKQQMYYNDVLHVTFLFLIQAIQDCTLANTLSLWEMLSVEQAKQLTLINQVCEHYLLYM